MVICDLLYTIFPGNVSMGDIIKSCERLVQCADNARWREQINSKERQ